MVRSKPRPARTIDAWLKLVRHEMDRGDNIVAYNLGLDAMSEYPDVLALEHATVLALARSGATGQAQQLLTTLKLSDKAGRAAADALGEDVAALAARLAKDRAFAVTGDNRRELAREAARLYESAYTRFQRYYTCINAATMWLVAGDKPKSIELARTARRIAAAVGGIWREKEAYWIAAAEAEAAILLGELADASEALGRASNLAKDNPAALGVTRKQLRLICEISDIDTGILDALRMPGIIHYCGHMISPPNTPGRFQADEEAEITERIAAPVAENDVGAGFGSLACGADIIFAEALLEREAELNVVMPFNAEEFKRTSVARGGEGWVERFDRCLEEAHSVTYATDDEYLDDDVLFGYAAEIAMGLARLRAFSLAATAVQVAVWDGAVGNAKAGTGADVVLWRERGGTTHVIPTRNAGGAGPTNVPSWRSNRVTKAMLFGDVEGFSKLGEALMPAFFSKTMGRFAEVLDAFDAAVEYRNSWGDGLYVVLGDVSSAADCALSLQAAVADTDPAAFGLPDHLGLRLGAHVGPIFQGKDPIQGRQSFYGTHVIRTARIEPIIPAGEVYVTEPFAALLALESRPRFNAEYAGEMAAAKGYGTFRMYVLKRQP